MKHVQKTARCVAHINDAHFAGNTAANNGEQSLDPSAAVMAVDGTAESNVITSRSRGNHGVILQ